MTKQRLGWGLVVAAGILFLAQLLPNLATPHRGKVAHVTAVVPGPLTSASPQSVTRFEAPSRGAMSWQLLVDRGGDGSSADILLASGTPGGRVRFGTALAGDRGRSQSPDGTIVAEGGRLTGRGTSADLSKFGDPSRTSSFTWSDDSDGVCGLEGDGTRATYLVVFAFARGGLNPSLVGRFQLPADLSYAGELGPSLLACGGTRGLAVIGLTDPAQRGRVIELDMVSGAVRSRREFAAAPGGFVASPDGSLVASNGRTEKPAVPSTIIELRSGRVLLSLGGERLVRAFSADNGAVLVSPAVLGGASLLSLNGGESLWSDGSDRQLVGWQVEPGAGRMAVALATRRLDTCTKGEPGKFPEFCQLAPLQDLLVIPAVRGARPLNLGRGVGLFGYAVS